LIDKRKKLKVLASAYACNPNPKGNMALYPGEAITGWNLISQLSRFHEICVITMSQNRPDIEEAIRNGELHGVRFYYVDLSIWMRPLKWAEFGKRIYYYLWQISAWRVAKKLHQEFNFDVAHHVTFGNDWIPSFIGAYLPVPFIWGPVGGGQRTPRSFLNQYSFGGRLAELSRSIAQWIGRNLLYSRRQCLKKARAILVCNYETRAKIPQQFLDKVHLFPVNGIAEEYLNRDFQKQNPNDKFLTLTAGRLHRLKGFDIAIRAFYEFSKKYRNAILEIVGKGTEESRLHQLVNNLGLESRVRFTPWLPHKDVLARMREADVFLFPSFRDGGGAVVVEAMASGIPVICLNTGGPGFHIQDEWGIKIEPKSPEYAINEMAKALERLYLDKDLRLRLGQAARKRAEEFYLWDRLGEKMQGIYEEALKQTSH
jgi:glycosyltransferase involved in cell wall biosynthesis